MYARVSHILLSLLGPVDFGYMHSPYVVLVGGALWKLTASSRGDRSGSSRARLTIAVSILSGILFQIRRGLGLPSSRASPRQRLWFDCQTAQPAPVALSIEGAGAGPKPSGMKLPGECLGGHSPHLPSTLH